MQPTMPYTGNPISDSQPNHIQATKISISFRQPSHIQAPQSHSVNPITYKQTKLIQAIQPYTGKPVIYKQPYLMQATQPPTLQLYAGNSQGLDFKFVLPNLKHIQSICIFYIKGKGRICQIDMAENTHKQ